MNLKKLYSKQWNLKDSSNSSCYNDIYSDVNGIIGREQDLRKSINILLNETVDTMLPSQYKHKSWIGKIKDFFGFTVWGTESETEIEVNIFSIIKLKHKIMRKK